MNETTVIIEFIKIINKVCRDKGPNYILGLGP